MNWYGYNLDTRSNLNPSFGLDFDLGGITQGLSLKGMISYDAYGNSTTRGNMYQTDYQAFMDPETDELTFSVSGLKQDNFYMSYGEGSRYNINVQGQLLYNRTFGEHTVGGMLRAEEIGVGAGGADYPLQVLGLLRATYDMPLAIF